MHFKTCTYHSGMVELSKLNSLSRWESLFMCSLYLLLLNISSAFCMLKEQHMPRFVGNNVKMLGQSSFTPFHEHHLIIPRNRTLCLMKVSSMNIQYLRIGIYHIHDCSCSLHSLHQSRVSGSSKAARRVLCSCFPCPY